MQTSSDSSFDIPVHASTGLHIHHSLTTPNKSPYNPSSGTTVSVAETGSEHQPMGAQMEQCTKEKCSKVKVKIENNNIKWDNHDPFVRCKTWDKKI